MDTPADRRLSFNEVPDTRLRVTVEAFVPEALGGQITRPLVATLTTAVLA